MDHDLRYDSDETQHNLPAVKATLSATALTDGASPGTHSTPDVTAWPEKVIQRLRVLELAVDRLANAVQVLILRMDDGK